MIFRDKKKRIMKSKPFLVFINILAMSLAKVTPAQEYVKAGGKFIRYKKLKIAENIFGAQCSMSWHRSHSLVIWDHIF